MEGQDNYFYSYSNPYGISFYDPCLSYYPYFDQTAFQSVSIPYNQYSSSFISTNQNYLPSSFTPNNLELNTPSSPNYHQIYTQVVPHRHKSNLRKKPTSTKLVRRQKEKKEGRQKENRNVYSNILRSFFKKIHEDQSIYNRVSLVIQKKSLSLTTEQFFEYLRQLKINYGKYLRFKMLRYLFMSQELPEHSLIFRLLFEHFNTTDFLPHTLTSKKIGRWSRTFHLKGGRELKQKLFN